jgi:shikimate dehydrogenase
MPLKTAVLPLLDTVTPLAEAVGAVNTVVLDDGRAGDNTDVGGFVAALRGAGVPPGPAPVVLGAGGTARAAVAALAELACPAVDVAVRDPGRAAGLLATAERLGVTARLTALDRDVLAGASLVVSTLPAGAADLLAAAGPWPAGVGLFDVVYSPWPTPLAAAAHAAGAPVVGGLALLVEQAALQVERMTGRAAPVAVMREAGRAALRAREAGAG